MRTNGGRRARMILGALALALALALVGWLAMEPRVRAPLAHDAARPNVPGLRGAAAVELLVWPDDGEDVIPARLNAARERIYLKLYLLTDRRVVEALIGAHARGVEVRVLLEPEPVGASSRAAFERLRDAGIATRHTAPAVRFTHEKSIVIDDEVLILTANATPRSFRANREFGVALHATADVAEVVAAFQADWNHTAFTPVSAALVWSPANARERISALIGTARATLDVYALSAQDDEQLELLIDAARRGVRVRVLTPPSEPDADTGGADDVDADHDAGLARLQRGGVEVRVLAAPYVHAKVFLVDVVSAFVGSQNISTTSLDYNRELGVIVQDPMAVARISETFQYDWDRAQER